MTQSEAIKPTQVDLKEKGYRTEETEQKHHYKKGFNPLNPLGQLLSKTKLIWFIQFCFMLNYFPTLYKT